MIFETENQKAEIRRWCRLAIQLNGAAESGHYDYITTDVIARELEVGNVFESSLGNSRRMCGPSAG